ncbi:MAG: hypothetical protein IPK97_20800 [Ahniella sp.]|nr:hypothetical protein [Ahniella sp.]
MRSLLVTTVLGLGMVVSGAVAAHEVDEEDDRLLQVQVAQQCHLDVDIRTDGSEACWTMVCDAEPARRLGCDLSALHQIYDVQLAPDGQHLVVMSVGEGHPMLEVVTAEPLFDRGDYRAQCTLNPYPGTFGIVTWQDNGLLVVSDVDLAIEPSELRAASAGEKDHRYLLDPKTCALTPDP